MFITIYVRYRLVSDIHLAVIIIIYFQASDSTAEDDQESDSGESGGWGQTITLPPCDISHVTELENLINSSMSSNNTREVIANSLLRGE